MPRKSKNQAIMDEYKAKVLEAIRSGSIVNAVGAVKCMPPRDKVREELDKPPINITDRRFRVILVEDLGDYKVYIQVPGGKTEYDFFVWRGIFNENGEVVDLKIPSHDDLGKMYLSLRERSPVLDEYLVNATIRFIRDRLCIGEIIDKYFKDESEDNIKDLKKFLLTLKWIALQEDANYPPPNLGSLYTLSVYVLLEVFGNLSAIRKIVRF